MNIFESIRAWLNHVDPHVANLVIAAFAGVAGRHMAGMAFGFFGASAASAAISTVLACNLPNGSS